MAGKGHNDDESKKDMGKKGGESRKGSENTQKSSSKTNSETSHEKHVKAGEQSHKNS